jgi:nucleotide-binding universal stress UspA family protein
MSLPPPSAADAESPRPNASPELAEAGRSPDPSLGERLRYAPIVVALSGGADGAGPVRLAAVLERRFGSRVSAVHVKDTSGLPLPAPLPAAFTYARELIGDAPYAKDAAACRVQCSDWLGGPNEWPIRIAVGPAASEVLRYAQREGAALIVMGLRRHGVVDRVLRDETTLVVARRARATVLGVAPSLQTLPRDAVVGVDFGPASVRAARAALDVLAQPTAADPTTLRLVYVDRSGVDGTHEDTAGEALIKQLGVTAAFERLVTDLAAPRGVRVEWVVRHGEPADELLAYAEESRADLIAIGSLRHERIERWILGSVTTEVIRDGRCSVLVIPPL